MKLGGTHGARRDSAIAQADGRMKQSSAKQGKDNGSVQRSSRLPVRGRGPVTGPTGNSSPLSFSPLPPQPMSEEDQLIEKFAIQLKDECDNLSYCDVRCLLWDFAHAMLSIIVKQGAKK